MNISTSNLKKSLVQLLQRFHILLFAIIILGALTIAIYLLNRILVTSDQSNGYVSQSSSNTFDNATIHRLNQLRTMDDPSTPLNLSTGRLNPFVEQ